MWNTSGARLLKVEVSIKPMVPQNLSIIPNNIVMSMEHIFKYINKQMMETTYTMKLGQLLKITLDLKKYMWQKLKPKKLNITSKVISEPNVTIAVETHYQIDTVTIKGR